MTGPVSGTPSVSLSCMATSRLRSRSCDRTKTDMDIFLVANNFWGKDDAGVAPMLERVHNAKTTCDELKAFYSSKW